MRGGAEPLGDLDKSQAVRAVGRADHDHAVALAGDRLHRVLTVRGGIADVLPARPADCGEPVLQRRYDVAGVVDRQRRLGQIGQKSEEHTSELQSLMRISYAVFCLKKKK